MLLPAKCRIWHGTIAVAIALALPALAWGQQHLIDEEGTVVSCGFYFLDDGGALSAAADGAVFTQSFCPEDPGGDLTFSFISFALGAGDTLHLWHGPAAAGIPDTSFTGNALWGTDVGNVAGVDNPSGCLTWRFTSDASGPSDWAALVTCDAPCARPVVSATATRLGDTAAVASVPSVPVELCLGESVSFDAGSSSIAAPGTATWQWDFGDGTGGLLGPAPQHAYAAPGIYPVQLTVTDSSGCSSVNDIEITAHVAAPIDIDLAGLAPVVCAGGGAVLQLGPEGVTTSPVASQPIASFGAGMAIPDLVGQSFSSDITFSGFPFGQTVSELDDLVGITLNLEHSFILDLDISIECPNGSAMVLQSWPGGFGGCVDAGLPVTMDATPEPGGGFDYTWSPEGQDDWQTTALSLLPNPTSGCAFSTPPLPAGTYAATGDWTPLIGCPINGTWTLNIMDTQEGDNGFLFGWAMDFAPAITPEPVVFEAEVGGDCASLYWAPLAPWGFLEAPLNACSSIVVEPTESGTFGYVLTATDAFGCTADTVVDITVMPAVEFSVSSDLTNALAAVDTTLCEGDPLVLSATPAGAVTPGTTYNWIVNGVSGGQTSPLLVDLDPVVGVYEVNFQATSPALPPAVGLCHFEWAETIEVVAPPTVDLAAADVCSNAPLALEIDAQGQGLSWNWLLLGNAGDTVSHVTWENPNIGWLSAGDYGVEVTVSDVYACQAEAAVAFTVYGAPDAGFTLDAVCAGEPLPFSLSNPADYADSTTSVAWSQVGGGALTDEGGNLGVTASGGGGFPQIALTLTTQHPGGMVCADTHTQFAMVHSLPLLLVSGPSAICDGEDATWFGAASIPFPNTVVSSHWSLTGGVELEQEGGVMLSLNAPPIGDYNLTYSGVSDQGCTSEQVVDFAVQSIPDAAFTLPAAVCAGTAVNAPAAASGAVETWTANGADLPVSGASFPAALTAVPGTVTVVHAVTLGSCSDTAAASLVVSPLPTASLAGPSFSCAGDPVFWSTDNTNPTSAPLTTTWTAAPGTAPLSTDASGADLGTPLPGDYAMTMTVTTAAGCADSTSATLFVGAAPDPEFTVSDVCEGTPIGLALTDTAGYAQADAGWQWNGTALSVPATDALPAAVAAAAGPQALSLTLSLDHPGITCTATHEATAVVHAQPTAAIAAPADFCAGPDATFSDATSIGAGVPLALDWTLDAGSGTGASLWGADPEMVLPTPAPGSYAVTLTATTPFGCTSSASDTLTVHADADAAFTLPAAVCAGTVVNAPAATSGAAETWTANGADLPVSGASFPAALTAVPGTVTVVHAVTLGSCSDTAAASLVVSPLPTASLAGPSFSCAGEPVFWSTDNTNPTSAPLTTTWTAAPGTAPLSTDASGADLGTPLPGDYAMTMTVTTAAGCADSTSATLFVGAAPDPEFTVSDVCEGTPIGLALTDTAGYAQADAGWQWNGTALSVPATDALPAAVAAAAGPQALSLTLSLDHPGITCTATHEATAVVHAQPTAAIAAPADFCAGPDATFSDATSIGAGVPLALDWTLDAGSGTGASLWGADPEMVLPTPAPGSYAVTLTATTPFGCTSSASDTLTVHADADAAFTLPAAVCAGTEVNAPAATSGAVETWTANGADLPVSGASFPAALTAVPGTVTVVHAVTLGSCSDTAAASLVVSPLPTASLVGPSFSCAGEPVFWSTDNTNPTSAPLTTTWTAAPGTAPLSTDASGADLGTPLPGDYAMTMTVTTAAGCADSTSATLFVGAAPDPEFTVSDVCEGTPIGLALTDTAGYAQADAGWQWNGTALSVPATDALPAAVAAAAGPQALSLTLSLDHPGITCTATHEATAVVHAQPTAAIAAPADFCAGPDATFSDATSIGAGVPLALDWTLDAGSGTGASLWGADPEMVLPTPAPGSYAVTLTATTPFGCTSSASDTLAVYAAPDATFALPSVICQSAELEVPTIATPGAMAWTLDGQPLASSAGTFDASATGQYGPRTMGVTVTLGEGDAQCADSHEETLMVEALPVADFNGAGAACAGDEVEWWESCVHPQGLSLSTAWTLDGQPLAVNAPSVTIGGMSAGSHVIALVATSPAGCASDVADALDFHAVPAPVFTVSEACSGTPLEWTADSTAFFGTATWSWAGNPIAVAPDTMPSVVSALPGNPTVVLSLAASYPSGVTCQATDSVTTTVYATPTAAIVGPVDLCLGETADYVGLGTAAGDPVLEYSWTLTGPEGAAASAGTTLSLAEPPAGQYDMVLEVLAPGGCLASSSASLHVVQGPTAGFSLPNEACAGDTVDVGLASGTVTADTTWSWNGQAISLAAGALPDELMSTSGVHTVALGLTLAAGTATCSSTAQQTIQIHAMPAPAWDLPVEICSGLALDVQSLSAISPPAPLTITWQWTAADTTTAAEGAAVALGILPSGVHGLGMQVEGPGGCTAWLAGSVEVLTTPEAAFTSEDVCAGVPLPAEPLDSVAFAEAAAEWTWNGNPTTVDAGFFDTAASSAPGLQSLGVTVTATYPSGATCSDSHEATAEVWANPTAAWDVPSGLCAGEAALFEAASTVASGATLNTAWQWMTAGDTLSVTGTTGSFGTAQEGLFQIALIEEAPGGCTDTLLAVVEVHPIPEVAFSAAAVCAGGAVAWTPQDPQGWPANTQWTWNGDPIAVDGAALPAAVSAEAGDQVITAWAEEIHADGTVCTAQAAATVQVHENPAPSWDVVPGWCAGTEAAFTATAGVTGAALQWSLIGSQGSTPYAGSAADLGLLPAGTYTLLLVAETTAGCVDSLESTVKVHTNPNADFTLTPACAGSPIPVSWPAEGDSLEGQWSWGSVALNGVTEVLPAAVSALPGVQWIQLSATESHPTGASCTASALQSVEVFPVPVAAVDGNTLWCADEVAVVHAAAPDTGAVTCAWSSAVLGNGAGPQWPLPEGALGNIPASLVVTSDGGCSDTLHFNVRIDPLPEVTLSDTLLMGCAPFEAALQAQATGYAGVVMSTVWTWPGGETQSATWSGEWGAGAVPVNCTVTAGDADLACSASAQATVVGLEVPEAAFSMFPEQPTVQQNEVTFTFEGGGPSAAFSWTVDGEERSAQPDWQCAFAPYFGDVYEVCLQVASPFGCVDEACRAVEVVGEVQVYVPSGFTPDNDGINDAFLPSVAPLEQVEDYRLEVFNRWGECVFVTTDPEQGWMGGYTSGTHFAGNEVYNWVITIDTQLSPPRRMVGQVTAIR